MDFTGTGSTACARRPLTAVPAPRGHGAAAGNRPAGGPPAPQQRQPALCSCFPARGRARDRAPLLRACLANRAVPGPERRGGARASSETPLKGLRWRVSDRRQGARVRLRLPADAFTIELTTTPKVAVDVVRSRSRHDPYAPQRRGRTRLDCVRGRSGDQGVGGRRRASANRRREGSIRAALRWGGRSGWLMRLVRPSFTGRGRRVRLASRWLARS